MPKVVYYIGEEVRIRDDAESVSFLRGMRVRIECIWNDGIIDVSAPNGTIYNTDVQDIEKL